MSASIQKRFNTVETVQLLLKHREVMFTIIKLSDEARGNAIPEMAFLRAVAEYQQKFDKDVANEIALVFDINNLMQAKIINDKKSTSDIVKLWFNNSVIDIFRLCKISLYRALTKTTLKATMTPIWAIVRDVNTQQLSITPGTEEYEDWLGEINDRIVELLGNIKANISKLQRAGDAFQKKEKGESLALTQAMYHEASKLYRREIEPLRVFLDKEARYEKGDGIYRTLESLTTLFARFNDIESQSLMNRYQLQYLELFEPIKKVADSVSIYLRKTKKAIIEHNAIGSAFELLRSAYNSTLGSDRRTKFINVKELAELGSYHPIASIGRITPCKLDKSPAYFNTVFNELAYRNAAQVTDSNERFLFEESIDSSTSEQIRHSLMLNDWIDTMNWPMNEDFIELAYTQLKENLIGFSIPDLLEIGSKLHTSSNFNLTLTNEFNIIEDDKHRLEYRIRLLSPNTTTNGRKTHGNLK